MRSSLSDGATRKYAIESQLLDAAAVGVGEADVYQADGFVERAAGGAGDAGG